MLTNVQRGVVAYVSVVCRLWSPQLLTNEFFFIGILEEMPLSMQVYCQIGPCDGGGGAGKKGRTKNHGRRLFDLNDDDGGGGGDDTEVDDTAADDARGEEDLEKGSRFRDDFEEAVPQNMRWGGATGMGHRQPRGTSDQSRGGGRKLLQKHSAKPSGFQLSDALKRSIMVRNQLDMAIYNFGKYCLHQRAANAGFQPPSYVDSGSWKVDAQELLAGLPASLQDILQGRSLE